MKKYATILLVVPIIFFGASFAYADGSLYLSGGRVHATIDAPNNIAYVVKIPVSYTNWLGEFNGGDAFFDSHLAFENSSKYAVYYCNYSDTPCQNGYTLGNYNTILANSPNISYFWTTSNGSFTLSDPTPPIVIQSGFALFGSSTIMNSTSDLSTGTTATIDSIWVLVVVALGIPLAFYLLTEIIKIYEQRNKK